MSKGHFVVLMAMIMAAGPFAVDAYLPGIPSMAEYLGVGVDSVATTVSFYIFGMALGQLIGGPFADRFEKRSIIIGGLVLYAASSLIIASASDLHVIQISRILQAVGGGFAGVCIAPLVRMREKGNAAAKLFGLIALIMVLAPAIAPSIGALILLTGKWQNIFYFTAAYALFVATLVAKSLPKCPPKASQEKIPAYRRYLQVMQNRVAMRYLLVQACGYSVMMVFVTNASFIYQGQYGLSEQIFGLAFAANTLVNVLVNRSNAKLLNSLAAHKLLRAAIVFQAFFVFALVIFTAIEVSVYVFALGIMGAVGMLGAIMPNANALYMSQFKENTGSASALLGAGQFLAGALMGGLTTQIYNGTLWPVVLVMLSLVIISNIVLPKEVEKAPFADMQKQT
ncbi:multidrug effflux MFS transporter [Vibrio sp. JC009]|uniref:multidrug effflux MFS transporter n=1 Tax=Vibrio sp. JC009 TaxID=2912314 RepID=UPI0023B0B009|nr:multidrug effflux MFS transporter [Vibrio sp. JC009]WED23676.1 multidrug effflux MFS transporter [Vibrio sp. JC009]